MATSPHNHSTSGPVDFTTFALLSQQQHQTIVDALADLTKTVTTISNQQAAADIHLANHMIAEEKNDIALKDAIHTALRATEAKCLSGFPSSDPVAHNNYHVGIIDETLERKKRIAEIVTFAIKSIVISAGGVLLSAIWFYFKHQVAA